MTGLGAGWMLRWLMRGRSVVAIERGFWLVVGTLLLLSSFAAILDWLY